MSYLGYSNELFQLGEVWRLLSLLLHSLVFFTASVLFMEVRTLSYSIILPLFTPLMVWFIGVEGHLSAISKTEDFVWFTSIITNFGKIVATFLPTVMWLFFIILTPFVWATDPCNQDHDMSQACWRWFLELYQDPSVRQSRRSYSIPE